MNKNMNKNMNNNKWRKEHEIILKKWGERALCYRWLHDKSYKKYWNITISFNIPTIILSTITGAANFVMQSIVPPDYQLYAQVGIGGMSILAGIIQTLSSYLQFEAKTEGHRVACISWGKLGRAINIELIKLPDERQNPSTFIDICSSEYERLIEQSPDIPEDIINIFKNKIDKHFNNVSIPDVCNGVEPIIPSGNVVSAYSQINTEDIINNIELTHKMNSEICRELDENIPKGHVDEIRKRFQNNIIYTEPEQSPSFIDTTSLSDDLDEYINV
jgi:hypothetical protein